MSMRKLPNVNEKVAQKSPRLFSQGERKLLIPSQNLPKIWGFGPQKLSKEALKSCPNGNKSSNLVTLVERRAAKKNEN